MAHEKGPERARRPGAQSNGKRSLEAENADIRDEALHLRAHRVGGRGHLLDQRGVLLRDLVHLGHGDVDEVDARALFDGGGGDLRHDAGHVLALQAMGVDVLFAQNSARITDFRRGEKLGKRDHRVSWPKPKARPDWMSGEDYAALPDELTLREVKVGKKILVTSFLYPRKVCKRALGQLFQQRWHVELDLRAIKTTLQMA